MNLEFRRLQANLVDCVNSAQLPTEGKRLVVMEVLMKLEAQVEKEIALELEAQKKKESESNELHTDTMEERRNAD